MFNYHGKYPERPHQGRVRRAFAGDGSTCTRKGANTGSSPTRSRSRGRACCRSSSSCSRRSCSEGRPLRRRPQAAAALPSPEDRHRHLARGRRNQGHAEDHTRKIREHARAHLPGQGAGRSGMRGDRGRHRVLQQGKGGGRDHPGQGGRIDRGPRLLQRRGRCQGHLRLRRYP